MAKDKLPLDTFFKALGTLITQFRKEKGYSLEELGLRIGIDRSAMYRIEKGKPVNVSTIVKLALALERHPKDFFNFDFNVKSQLLGEIVKGKKSSKGKTKKKK